jgi:hypothetical protein
MLRALSHFLFCSRDSGSEIIAKTYRSSNDCCYEVTELLHRCKHCGHTWKNTLYGKEVMKEEKQNS